MEPGVTRVKSGQTTCAPKLATFQKMTACSSWSTTITPNSWNTLIWVLTLRAGTMQDSLSSMMTLLSTDRQCLMETVPNTTCINFWWKARLSRKPSWPCICITGNITTANVESSLSFQKRKYFSSCQAPLPFGAATQGQLTTTRLN